MTNSDRDYLTPDEVDRLLNAAKKYGKHPARNYCMILLCYRHGLRISELCSLKWSAVDWKDERLFVSRAKNGKNTTHPLGSDELKALKKLLGQSPNYVFVSDRGGHLSERQFRTLIATLGEKAGLGDIHPHQLRHACGYYLANRGTDTRTIQDYLGHRQISSTVRYTELSAKRFEGLWDELPTSLGNTSRKKSFLP